MKKSRSLHFKKFEKFIFLRKHILANESKSGSEHPITYINLHILDGELEGLDIYHPMGSLEILLPVVHGASGEHQVNSVRKRA